MNIEIVRSQILPGCNRWSRFLSYSDKLAVRQAVEHAKQYQINRMGFFFTNPPMCRVYCQLHFSCMTHTHYTTKNMSHHQLWYGI